MSMAAVLGGIARSVSAAVGAGYFLGTARWVDAPTLDDGGSIVAPGTPVEIACDVQVDSVTEAMRGSAEYRDKDMRLLILAVGLPRPVDTNAVVTIGDGPFAGTSWRPVTVSRDPAGAYFECLGRRA